MKITITKDNKAWQNIKKDLFKGADEQISLGFFESSKYGPENDNLPVAFIASIQEEGSPPQNIPPRPFMRVGFGAPLRRGKYDKQFKAAIANILEGRSTFTHEYKKLGSVFVEDMKDVITKWDSPPNAPLTVAEKGFNDPLIDSGTMRDSVDFKVEKKGIE